MIETIIEEEAWRESLGDALSLAAQCADAVAASEAKFNGNAAILLTNDAAVMALNTRFRGHEKPTNVLAFPAGDGGEFLGDIALGFETCQLEAGEKNIAITDHAAHLMVHAMLHLIGYDHQTDADADKMEMREAKILASMGIANPYADAMETII